MDTWEVALFDDYNGGANESEEEWWTRAFDELTESE